jgi:UDP-N-acetylglucosamine diphosphorylase / glucose-1-phosphate thymidylyltransferase / UDP-N-acetylgalactosamine diphosphorylase / glucosamine-1-phosphate N-acetyltransferase / galactosamine-1-phosphate N-acetyltransferase
MLATSEYFSPQDWPFFSLFEESETIFTVLKKLSHYLEKQNTGKIEALIPSGVFLENPEAIFIGKGTVIEPGAYIRGPVWIGKDCEIRHGAYVRGQVILGDGVVIGHGTEVKNSILFPKAHASHFNYIGDSILGANTNLGAGVKCANFRLDQEEISVLIEGKKIKTGLRKMGLILGDRSQIGCNCVTNPGTVIGKDVLCAPCINISGTIPHKTKIKSQKTYTVEACT